MLRLLAIAFVYALFMAAHLRTSRKRGSHPEKSHGSRGASNPFTSKSVRNVSGGLSIRAKRDGDDTKARNAAQGRKIAETSKVSKPSAKPKPAFTITTPVVEGRRLKSGGETFDIYEGQPSAEMKRKELQVIYGTDSDGNEKLYFTTGYTPDVVRAVRKKEGLTGDSLSVGAWQPDSKTLNLDNFSDRSAEPPDGLKDKIRESGLNPETIYWNERPLSLEPEEEGGVSVDKAFTEKPEGPVGRSVNHGLDAINSVHGDGNLRAIPFGKSDTTGSEGDFATRDEGGTRGKPTGIRVSTNAKEPEFTAVHEIGHFLDYDGFDTPGIFGSERSDGELDGVMNRLSMTPSVKRLEAMLDNPGGHEVEIRNPMNEDEPMSVQPDRRYMQYITSPRELFARGYAQYIATKSDDPLLKDQLDARRGRSTVFTTGGAVPFDQWPDAEFAPIVKEFDKLFAKKGWLR